MKKTVIAIIFLAVCITAYSQDKPQIPNGDFETWTYDGANLPNNWNSFQTADGGWAGTAYKKSNRQVARSTDTRPGSSGRYSCRIWSREINAVVVKALAQGNLTTGRVHAGATKATSPDNYNYSDRGASTSNNNVDNPCAMEFKGKPDSLVAWIKFSPKKSSSKAMLNAFIHDNCDFIKGYAKQTEASHIVASVEYEVGDTKGAWKRISLPFKYGTSNNPQYILINIATNTVPGEGSEGDELYIDDIEMIYNSKFELSMPSCGWASMYLDFNAEVPSGATAWYATKMESGYVTLEEVPAGKSIPANTAVLISSSKSSLTFVQSSASPATLSGNILSGTASNISKDSGYDYYVLSGDATTSSAPSFAKYNGSSLAKNKAFIKVRK